MTAQRKWYHPVISFLICGGFALYGCSPDFRETPQQYRDSRITIGTYVQIDVCVLSSEAETFRNAMQSVWGEFAHIQRTMNAYDPESDIGRINNADGAPVPIHPDLYVLIQKAVFFSNETGGAFDITVRPLIELWHRAREEGRLPLDPDLEHAKSSVGIDKIYFPTPDSYAVGCAGCRLDLGGIAKGYAVDRAVTALRHHHFQNFLIDAGGDLYAAGIACDGRPWRIGVRDPRDPDELISIVELLDQAATTSGNYEQFYNIEGRRFSHIIDPDTGMPLTHSLSTTVIAPTAIEADVFSTALMIRDPAWGIRFIEDKGPGYAAFLLSEDKGQWVEHKSASYINMEVPSASRR